MRKMLFNIFIIMLLVIYSMLFVSCEAITSQNITDTGSTPGINGGTMKNGGPGMHGDQGNDPWVQSDKAKHN